MASKMQKDKEKDFSTVKKLGVIGVSNWTCTDAKQSTILKMHFCIKLYIIGLT